MIIIPISRFLWLVLWLVSIAPMIFVFICLYCLWDFKNPIKMFMETDVIKDSEYEIDNKYTLRRKTTTYKSIWDWYLKRPIITYN